MSMEKSIECFQSVNTERFDYLLGCLKSILACFLLTVVLFSMSASAAVYYKNKEYLHGQKFVADFEKLYWAPSPENEEADRLQGHMMLKVSTRPQNVMIVFQSFDTKGELLTTFSVTPKPCSHHPMLYFRCDRDNDRFPFCGVENPLVDVDSYNKRDEHYFKDGERAWFYVDFKRERQAQSLRIINVVVDGNEVPYNVRVVANRLLRSLSKPPEIKHGTLAEFGSEDSCKKWVCGEKADGTSEDEKSVPLPTISKPVKEDIKLSSGLPKPVLVEVRPGAKTKIAECNAGDLLIIRYAEGMCGRSASTRTSPDDENSKVRPALFYEKSGDYSKKRYVENLSAGTQKRPQALRVGSSATYWLEFRSSVIGTATYRIWVVPAEKVDDFLKTPQGESIQLCN